MWNFVGENNWVGKILVLIWVNFVFVLLIVLDFMKLKNKIRCVFFIVVYKCLFDKFKLRLKC